MSSMSIGFLNDDTCWCRGRIGELSDYEYTEVQDLNEGFKLLQSNDLDAVVIPARALHGRQIEMVSSGLSVAGAVNQHRSFHVVVADDRLSHLPRSAIVISGSKIVRRQLRRFRRDLRVLSPTAWSGIQDIPLPKDGVVSWLEDMRQNGVIDAYTMPRESFDRLGLKARRFALWPDPKEAGGLFFLPPMYSDLPIVITREGFPKKRIRDMFGKQGEAAWHVMNQLFGAESEDVADGIGILVQHRTISSLIQQAESTRDLALEQSCRDSEGVILPEGSRLFIRVEYVSKDGTRTFRMDRLIEPENLHSGCVTMGMEWRTMFSTLSKPQSDHPRLGAGSPAFFNNG